MKRNITICIDEDLHKLCKIRNINLSSLINDYLNYYLYNDNNNIIGKQNNSITEIKEELNQEEEILKEKADKVLKLKHELKRLEIEREIKMRENLKKVSEFSDYINRTRGETNHIVMSIGGKNANNDK